MILHPTRRCAPFDMVVARLKLMKDVPRLKLLSRTVSKADVGRIVEPGLAR